MKQDNALRVYYDEKLVGTLAMTADHKAAFQYDDEWLENGIEDSETKKLFTAVNDRMDKIEKLVRQIQEPKNKYDYTSLNYKNSPEKIDTYYIKNIEDEIEKLELEINSQNFQDKDTIKRWQLYKNRLDKSIGDGE